MQGSNKVLNFKKTAKNNTLPLPLDFSKPKLADINYILCMFSRIKGNSWFKYMNYDQECFGQTIWTRFLDLLMTYPTYMYNK